MCEPQTTWPCTSPAMCPTTSLVGVGVKIAFLIWAVPGKGGGEPWDAGSVDPALQVLESSQEHVD